MSEQSATHCWLSIVIPIKDERDNLIPLTQDLIAVLQACPEARTAPFEILFVDDGSSDGSGEVLDDLAKQHDPVRVLHFDRNYGKTAALHAGFRHARGEIIVIMDGDLQNRPTDIPTLLGHLGVYDLACGLRAVREDNIVRRISSRLANFVRNAVIQDQMHDTGCGFMAFRRTVVEDLPLFEGLHRFFPALAQMRGYRVTEVPVQHSPRIHGVSKYGIRNRLFKGLYDMFAVRWMQKRCLRYRIARHSAADGLPVMSSASNSSPR